MPHNRVLRFNLRLLILLAASQTAYASPYQRSYLVDSVSLPISQAEAGSYAIDLNGDGPVDNNFGSMLAAFASQGIDFNGAMNAAIADGSIVHLVDQQSTDASFTTDPAALANWYVGNPLPQPPLFDGTDQPSYSHYAPGMFLAALSSGSFTSPSPVTTTSPVDLTLMMQFGPSIFALPLQGTRLSFTTNSVGPGHMQGQLNGSIRHNDYLTTIPPALAQWFTSIIQTDPTSATAMQLKQLFDTGCNGSGANDNGIAVCEITGNALMAALMAPDVQIRDANGNYAPNPANTIPDANSFGVRFTAVRRDRVFANGFEP